MSLYSRQYIPTRESKCSYRQNQARDQKWMQLKVSEKASYGWQKVGGARVTTVTRPAAAVSPRRYMDLAFRGQV
jgi:hypothetical protein